MLSDLKIINPLDIQNWDKHIPQHSDYSFSHSFISKTNVNSFKTQKVY
jgi:hypothetical protein